jgi:hypothetical protein
VGLNDRAVNEIEKPVNIDSYGLRCLWDVIKEILAGKEFSVTLRGCCFCFKWPTTRSKSFIGKFVIRQMEEQIIIVLKFEQSINSRHAKTVCSLHRIT